MVSLKKCLYGTLLALALTLLGTAAGMEPGPNREELSPVSDHPSCDSSVSGEHYNPNRTLPTGPLNTTQPTEATPIYQDRLDTIHEHISALRNLLQETITIRNLQSQLIPEDNFYVEDIINRLMNLIGRLTHEEQYLELNPQGNIDSVLETLHSITPIIQAHHQRAINRLQIICDNLVEELDQHNRTLLTSCDNMIRQIQRCQLWILLHRVLYHCFSCLRRYYPNIILPNLPPVNTSCILDICSHASIDLRDRRTHYRTTFQRLESMLGENNQHNPALLQHKAEMLSTLDKTMQLEGLVLEIRRQIV